MIELKCKLCHLERPFSESGNMVLLPDRNSTNSVPPPPPSHKLARASAAPYCSIPTINASTHAP
jgi:hypothetical protein